MLRPERMKKVELIVLERHARKIVRVLGRMGVMHLTRSSQGGVGLQQSADRIDEELRHVHQLEDRLETILSGMGLAHKTAEPAEEFVDINRIEGDIRRIEKSVSKWLDEVREIDGEIEKLENLRREASTFAHLDVPLSEINNFSFLHFAVGTMRHGTFDELREKVGKDVVLVPFEDEHHRQQLIAATTRKDRWSLQTALEEVKFRPESPETENEGLPSDILRRTEQRLDELRRRKHILEVKLNETNGSEGPRLLQHRQRLRLEARLLETERMFGHTWSSVLITGWIPEADLHRAIDAVLEITGEMAVVDVVDAEVLLRGGEDVPIKFRNHPLIRPFEMFVKGMGVPGYTEIEPTIFVAIVFLGLFGLMFGDVGQGGVILLGGALLHWRGRTKHDLKLQDMGTLGVLAGAASVIFGFLYGSLFGLPPDRSPLHPLWMEPMEDPMTILLATVGVGTIVISIGVILNIVNRLRAKDYKAGLLGQFGVAGFVFYWGALILAIKIAVSGGDNGWTTPILIVMGVALLGLLLREPIVAIITKEGPLFEHGVVNGFFEMAVEGMELILAYLSNTISFIRVGAFALAHACLSIAIFKIEGVARELPGGPVWSVVALVFGNAIVIGLEGMIVMIQIMRLEYYEFFNKFLEGTGTPFEPFELR